MLITVLDKKHNKSTVCSKIDAAKIIGVCSQTILRWSKKGTIEEYNQFLICFNSTVIKQKKGRPTFKTIRIV
jgi:predicted site-specific integrase-resolvase